MSKYCKYSRIFSIISLCLFLFNTVSYSDDLGGLQNTLQVIPESNPNSNESHIDELNMRIFGLQDTRDRIVESLGVKARQGGMVVGETSFTHGGETFNFAYFVNSDTNEMIVRVVVDDYAYLFTVDLSHIKVLREDDIDQYQDLLSKDWSVCQVPTMQGMVIMTDSDVFKSIFENHESATIMSEEGSDLSPSLNYGLLSKIGKTGESIMGHNYINDPIEITSYETPVHFLLLFDIVISECVKIMENIGNDGYFENEHDLVFSCEVIDITGNDETYDIGITDVDDNGELRLDSEELVEFIKFVTDPEIMKLFEGLLGRIDKLNQRKAKLLKEIQAFYLEFMSAFMREEEPAHQDAAQLIDIIKKVEEYVREAAEGRSDLTADEIKEMLEKYALLRKNTDSAVAKYLEEFKNLHLIFTAFRKIAEKEEEDQIHIVNDKKRLKVLISMKKKDLSHLECD